MKKLIPLVLMMASGCASDQYLRGEDYTKTEKVVIIEQPEEKPLSFQIMPHIIWITLVAGLGYWIWKDYKSSK